MKCRSLKFLLYHQLVPTPALHVHLTVRGTRNAEQQSPITLCHDLNKTPVTPDVTTASIDPQTNRSREKQDSFSVEQKKDPSLSEMIKYLESGALPTDDSRARKVLLQSSQFALVDGILYFIDNKQRNYKRAAVPKHLCQQVLKEAHSSPYAGHFSGQRVYNTLVARWWWEGMFGDAKRYASACPECSIVMGNGRVNRPPLHPIPVSRPFQILGIDVMDLPLTDQGNKHVVVIQDLFTKWPMVFAVPDQKTTRIARLIAEEVIPMFGVPECLLSDRGTNLLSKLMMELCRILGITKLNTTAYHPHSIGHSRLSSENTQPNSVVNGIVSYLGFSGPTGTPLIHLLVKSPHSSCSALTFAHLQKQPIFLQKRYR